MFLILICLTCIRNILIRFYFSIIKHLNISYIFNVLSFKVFSSNKFIWLIIEIEIIIGQRKKKPIYIDRNCFWAKWIKQYKHWLNLLSGFFFKKVEPSFKMYFFRFFMSGPDIYNTHFFFSVVQFNSDNPVPPLVRINEVPLYIQKYSRFTTFDNCTNPVRFVSIHRYGHQLLCTF